MKIKEPIIKNAKKQELFSTSENEYQDFIFENNPKDKIVISNCEINNCLFKDIDFSTSEIDGFAVTSEDLKGAIVNSEQAIACAKILGLKVLT